MTLVESIEKKYNTKLGVDKNCKLEDLLAKKGLFSMKRALAKLTK